MIVIVKRNLQVPHVIKNVYGDVFADALLSFPQQQLVQKREEERAEAAALESKATKRLANMASIAASKSMRSMPGLAR